MNMFEKAEGECPGRSAVRSACGGPGKALMDDFAGSRALYGLVISGISGI